MSAAVKEEEYYDDCSFVSIHYIICECGETFPSENGLRAHLEREHPHKRERKEFKCGVCGLVFGTEDVCISHYEAEHLSEGEVKQEVEEHEDKPDVLVAKEAVQELEIVFHVDSEGRQLYEQEYIEDYTDQQTKEENNVTLCDEMSQEVMLNEEVSQEIVLNEEMSQEVESNEEMMEEVISKEEVSAEQESVSNDGMSYVSQAELKQATRILVKANKNKQYPQIKVNHMSLNATLDKIPHLFNHIKEIHLQVQPPPLKMVRDADTGQLVLVFNRTRPPKKNTDTTGKVKVTKAIVCEVCGRKYASNAALRYHQRAHTGERPYRCHLCPKQFTMPLFLQIHVRTHTGERPYQCPECPKAFSNRAALLRHERVHTGVKPYTCPMCFKSFTQSNSMKLHVATVHLKQPAPYKSRTRRMKDAARGVKQPTTHKIKAFAPSGSSTSAYMYTSQSDAEYEVVIGEEVEDEEAACYEMAYDDQE